MITLLTASSLEYQPLHEITRASKIAYCERWGLQYAFRRHERVDCWERVEFWLDALDSCDWLFFMGADAMITNQDVDCAGFLNRGYEMTIGWDINGINCDVFFLRSSRASKEFLELVLERKAEFANEQIALDALIRQEPWFRAWIVPQRRLNSYLYTEYGYTNGDGTPYREGQWETGDFVLHLPGMALKKRMEIAELYASNAELRTKN